MNRLFCHRKDAVIMTGQGIRLRRYRRKRWEPIKVRDEDYRRFLPMKHMREISRVGRHGRWSHKPYFPFSGDKEMRDDHLRYGLR